MKAVLRGFLAGFGFALGASVAGTLIGYGLGKLGEASVKRLLSPEPTSSPAPSSSQPSSEPLCGESDGQGHTCTLEKGHTDFHRDLENGYHGLMHPSAPDDRPCSYCGEHHQGDPRHEAPESNEGPPPGDSDCTCYDAGCEEGLAMGSGVDQRPMTMTEAAIYRPNDHPYNRKEFVGHCVYEVAPGTVCGWDEAAHHSPDSVVPHTLNHPGSDRWTGGDKKAEVTYILIPGEDEDDGSDYFRALDRHDNAQKAEETETAEKSGRDGKQAS